VTPEGERIEWSEFYDGSKENTFECFNAARQFLGSANAPPAVDEARKQS
jgi:hypothetical protein